MNLRETLAKLVLKITRGRIYENYQRILTIEMDRAQINSIHREELTDLIIHCYKYVPYYQDILSDVGVIYRDQTTDNGITVNLDKFHDIPILRKDQLREHYDQLHSTKQGGNHQYQNSSGGSTGKPVVFIQDRIYQDWNWANKLYYADMVGKELGEPEIKLWGSQQDFTEGKTGWKNKLTNYIINRTLLNSFKMSKEDMNNYLEEWNRKKPVLVWTYVGSIYELAKYKRQMDISVHPPEVIVTTAGTLDEKMRTYIEESFGCDVINQYGAREEGAIACECRQKDGLHIFEHSHHVEVVGDGGIPVFGISGEIVVTNLHNYSMPLLRYALEDTGMINKLPCDCGRKFWKLQEISGRKLNHFVNSEGDIIHGMYFTHMFYYKPWVKKFIVVQRDFDLVLVKIETDQEPVKNDLNEFRERIKKVMGKECKVLFSFHKHLDPSQSGKFMFTKSEVNESNQR